MPAVWLARVNNCLGHAVANAVSFNHQAMTGKATFGAFNDAI
jgi:hypothetical protein